MALIKNGGEKNDLHLRTLEVAQIREDEYFGRLIADELKGILRDTRNEHCPDTTTADESSFAATVKGQLQEAMNFEGSSAEKKRIPCNHRTRLRRAHERGICFADWDSQKVQQPTRESTAADATWKYETETQNEEYGVCRFV